MGFRPFRNRDSFSAFKNHLGNTILEIQSLDNEYVLKASQTELEDYYIENVKIDPLVLHTDSHRIINLSGTQIGMSHDYRTFNQRNV